MINFKNFFEPEKVAIVGVSRDPNKIGHVIMKNMLDARFAGEVIPVSRNGGEILGRRVYTSVSKIEEKIDLAIISVPAKFVLDVVKDCNNKKIKDVLIISAGFGEIGNIKEEEELGKFLGKSKMRCIGVNCLGIYDAHNNLDTLFLPRYRLERPEPGSIGFICQSGAVGSAILDIATEQGHKFSKFVSYGNATQIDESDLLKYLGEDDETKVICLYIEGVKDGDKFFNVAKEVSRKKPIIVMKGGLTEKGKEATLSHTGALAGEKEVYLGVFKQTGIIRVESLEDMFNVASLVEKGIKFKGNNVQIITNGGGYGIVSTDEIVEAKNLEMASLSNPIASKLKKSFPKTVNVGNPLDLVGDATTERYRIALDACIKDKNIDSILLIALYQTPLLNTDIVDVISEAKRNSVKPIVVVSTGGEFTEALSRSLEDVGLPVFSFPRDAVIAMNKLVWYEEKKKSL